MWWGKGKEHIRRPQNKAVPVSNFFPHSECKSVHLKVKYVSLNWKTLSKKADEHLSTSDPNWYFWLEKHDV